MDKRDTRESSYFADATNLLEQARLLRQDRLATKSMGLFFRGIDDPGSFRHLLDVGCGPGGWALDVAQLNPHAQVTGIDIEAALVEAGRRQAQAETIRNVAFHVMDARQPLDFADCSFDYVQVRFAQSFLSPTTWPKLLRECSRVLEAGGTLSVADHEISVSTSTANERLGEVLNRAMHKAGRTYSRTGRSYGFAPAMRQLLRDLGFVDLRPAAHIFDVSQDVEDFKGWFENYAILFKSIKPFLLKNAGMEAEELDALFDQCMDEMQQERYCAVVLLTSWVCRKPLGD